ncbi:dTDP-glucose 4,6-dehydratase [Geomicrobium sp. JCM 19038]|uniref:dTDP-glucose 4,6-dehydratase n=1 Tax=Geomicrobium sp. JCM 19038 TaxID=1460635 RepID=UPI00045F232E|nr:dTDP-glucose 4,6-dehydratase [Geomicrobium sp. JCM 19038]GAK09763.1 dTDP-glucose 4,6-dehydratase [Geomicrobium sp. JCM 19038]
MNVLVTGGAGFIGSHFILHALEEDPSITIVNVDRLTYAADLSYLQQVEKDGRYLFVQADICDHDRMLQLVYDHRIEAIVNFAAESHVDRSIQDSAPFLRTNITGTHSLLEVARKCGGIRYVQISTDEVYGSLSFDDLRLFTEQSVLQPNNPYSASKAGADLLVRSYYETHGLPVNITRCSNNYGPHQHAEKLLPTLIERSNKQLSLPIYGDGKNIRDWLYVKDHVQAILLVLQKGTIGDVYNIGGTNEWANNEVAKHVLDYFGLPHSNISYVSDRPGHDQRYAIDASKIQQQLGCSLRQRLSKVSLKRLNGTLKEGIIREYP